MLERFTVFRRVEVNHTMNSLDIETTCCYIGRYNSMSFTLAKVINRLRTLLLRHSTVNTSYAKSLVFHLLSNTVYTGSSTAENESSPGLSNRFSTDFSFHRVRH